MKANAFYKNYTNTYDTLVSQISVWIDNYSFLRIKTKLFKVSFNIWVLL